GDVGTDPVALNDAVGRGDVEPDADAGVAGDQVAGAGRRAADLLGRGRLADEDAVEVGDRRRAAGVGADDVALDRLGPRRPEAANRDADVVAGDDVARPRPRRGRQAADGVVAGRLRADAVAGLEADGGRPVGRRADVVALDERARDGVVEVDVAIDVAADDVP